MPGKPILHADPTGGMDWTTRPHLLKPNQWRVCQDMRVVHSKLVQVPQLKRLYAFNDGFGPPLAVVNLPVGHSDFGIVAGLTATRLVQVGPLGVTLVKHTDGTYVEFASDSTYRRWGTCVHNNRLFFTNELNKVRYTDGTLLRDLHATNPIPSGRYVTVFYDHVVVGYPTYKGATSPWNVMWSNLHDYGTWDPWTSNEADSYICSEFQTGDERFPGVTGLGLWKDYCVVYTENAIYMMLYTGLPRVVHVRPLVIDYGCGFPYALGELNDLHAFIDTNHQNFFFLPHSITKTPEPIAFGDEIKEYFFADLNPDFALAAKTFAYKDRENMEAVWVYVSADSAGTYDKAVAFNWENKSWSVRNVKPFTCFNTCGRYAMTAYDMDSDADTYLMPANESCESDYTVGRVFGAEDVAEFYTEVTASDADSAVLGVPDLVLETGDFAYDSFRLVKEVKDILINAKATNLKAIRVELSARKYVDDPVVWDDVGLWTPTLSEDLLTFRPRAGRILRYRFTFEGLNGKPVRDAIFTLFEEYVSTQGATK